MRTPNLQYLYLQKPVSFVVVLCLISVLPWIGLGELSVEAGSETAAVAASILESGNWVLPSAGENLLTYHPPLSHWLIAAFSYPQGYVSEFTSRLPSVLAFMVLAASVLMFFGKRIRFQQAFISVLLLLTGIGMHVTGMSSGIAMLLTLFMLLGVFSLYRWEDEMQLKGLPVIIPFFLSCAILTGGPAGGVLPLTVFFVYLLVLNKYSLLTVFKAVLYVAVASMFLPLLWYIAAWDEGGKKFLDLVLAEHADCFLGFPGANISLWSHCKALLLGFMPWTVLVVFSLFGLRITKAQRSSKEVTQGFWESFRSLDKMLILSVVVLVCMGVVYLIPTGKPSVFLFLAYPFIALFLAQYLLYLSEYRGLVSRFFAGVLAVLFSVVLVLVILDVANVVELAPIVGRMTGQEDVLAFARALALPSRLTVSLLGLTALALGVVWYQLFKKINIKILYAIIALVYVVNMLFDSLL